MQRFYGHAMLHLRKRWIGPIPAAPRSAALALWDRLVASDPGLLRLMMALRGTSAVFLMTLVAVFAGPRLGAPPLELASGVTFSLMAPFLMREPTLRQRQRTLLMLGMPAVAATVATTVLHGHGPLGDCFFIVLVFAAFLLQARSPYAVGQGLMAVVVSYVGLYLELPPSTLPMQILSIAAAIPVTAFACFVLFPIRPAATLRRMVQAVQSRAARVLQDAGDPHAGPAAMRRSLAKLNEAALAADDQLALLAAGSMGLRQHLMDLELAAARLAAADCVGQTPALQRHANRLLVAGRRLRHSRWSARDRRGMGAPGASPASALTAITRAAAALGAAASLPPPPIPPAVPAPPGPLAWRVALRVTLASAAAMAGGMAVSPNRWFWAVITVYVVSLNTRSRGDTIYKGVQRVAGTLLGLIAGVTLAALLQGAPVAQIAVLLAAVFGLYYLFLTSYTLGIFCVTVMLGLLYSLLGADMDQLLVLRLEETVIGATAAIVSAVFILPLRTRSQISQSGIAVLKALTAAVAACRLVLSGEAPPGTPAAPLLAMRAVDRQVADLRLALMPLTVGRFMLRRAPAERPAQALLDCVHWTRMLAAAATGPDPALAAQADAIERRLAALAAGDRAVPEAGAPPLLASGAQAALAGLDRATAMLAERLAIGALHAFRLEG
jgi:uncharacterized membrane protein YccC